MQRQSRFPLLVDLMDALQSLAETARLHGEQRLIFEGELALFGEIDPDNEHTIWMLKRNACRPGLRDIRPEQVAASERTQPPLGIGRQVGPLCGLADRDQI